MLALAHIFSHLHTCTVIHTLSDTLLLPPHLLLFIGALLWDVLASTGCSATSPLLGEAIGAVVLDDLIGVHDDRDGER